MLQMWVGGSLDCRFSKTAKSRRENSLEHSQPNDCSYKSVKIDKAHEKTTEQNRPQKHIRIYGTYIFQHRKS